MSQLPKSISDGLERWREPVMEAIRRELPPPATRGDGSLADMIHYHLETGGKRLRPLIALLGTEAVGGDPQAALPFAAGVELLHNATLVHDDYQDGDRVRRSRPTVWVEYGWEQSINAGDGLYFAGLSLISRSPVADADLRRLTAMTSRRLLQVIEGQVNEFRLKGTERPSETEYIRVIRGKTAGLFALPLEGAGICAGLPDAEVAALAEAGDLMGLLFQVQDDLLDLIGEKGRDQVGTDIAEGKPSLPVVYALANAPAADADRLQAIVSKDREATTPDDIAEALALLERVGAIDYALKTVRDWRGRIRSGRPELDALLTDVTTAILAPIASRI